MLAQTLGKSKKFSQNRANDMSNRWTGIGASVLLAGITLGAFGTLRDAGPEAVVRRFHEAAIRNDIRTLDQISLHAQGSNSERILKDRVIYLHRANTRVGVRRVDRSRGNIVIAEFVYVGVNQATIIYWVALRTPTGWKVQTDETLGLRV
jgi:hypothetical protein